LTSSARSDGMDALIDEDDGNADGELLRRAFTQVCNTRLNRLHGLL
jgi:hypothetical protein